VIDHENLQAKGENLFLNYRVAVSETTSLVTHRTQWKPLENPARENAKRPAIPASPNGQTPWRKALKAGTYNGP